MSSAITDLVSLSFTLVAMVALSWQATAVVGLPVPAALVGRRMRRLSKEHMKRWGDLGVAIFERLNLAGALVIKLFGRSQTELERVTHRARRLRDTSVNSLSP